MKGSFGLVTAALLAIALTNGAQCRRDTQKYLPIASGYELEEPRFRELLAALVDDSIEGGEPVMMLSQLEAALPKANGRKRHIYGHLVALADLSSQSCPADMLATVLDISALLHESLDADTRERLGDYLTYVKRFGEQKFEVCLENLVERFEVALKRVDQGAERAFDGFLAAAFNSTSSDDQQLYQSAKDFSLAYEEFDAARMAEVASESLKLLARAEQPERLFFMFLTDTCHKLQMHLGQLFDLFNLARTLEKPGSEPLDVSSLPVKFLKLNEYNRLCIESQSARTKEDVLANVSQQLHDS